MGLFSAKVSTKDMVPLCRQMATAYDAGIPIIRTLEMAGNQIRDPKLRGIIQRMTDGIRSGGTLGDVARKESKFLPDFFIQLLSTGEHGGRLDVMLKDLADYFEDRLKMRRSMMMAAVLPALQVIIAWFLLTFAFRLIGSLNIGSGQPFGFGAFFLDYGLFQAKAMAIVALVFAGCVVLARLGIFRYIWGAYATFLWPLSAVTRRFALARFFRSMSLLIGSGLRVDHCIENSAGIIGNPYIQKDLLQAVPHVRNGETLVEAFSGSRFLTPTAHEMLLVGEHSGNLEGQLRKISQYHLDEANHAVSIATRVITVLVILGVALTIGFFVIRFYLTFYGGMMDELGI
jgi:type IV pilus assembly protein PilC